MDFFPQPEHDVSFDIDEPFKAPWQTGALTPLVQDSGWRNLWDRSKKALGLGALVGLLVAGAVVFFTGGGNDNLHPFVFFELRAIDAAGHPVAGAQVYVGDEDTGDVTDSFGEWRRYMRAPLGQRIPLRVVKNLKKQSLSGEKVVKTPGQRPKDGELEVKASILMSSGERQVAAPRNKGNEGEFLKREDLADPEVRVPEGDFAAVAIELQKATFDKLKPGVRGWARVFNEDLPGALYRRALEDGMKIKNKSPLQVRLRFIPVSERKSVVETVVTWKDQKQGRQVVSFLKSMNTTSDGLAKTIMETVRYHLPHPYLTYQDNGKWFVVQPKKAKRFWLLKGDEVLMDADGRAFPLNRDGKGRLQLLSGKSSPCGRDTRLSRCLVFASTFQDIPPVDGWIPLRVKIPAPVQDGMKVYFSGYQAHHVGQQVWEYWGQPGAESPVLIIRGGQVLEYQKVRDIPSGLAQISSKAPVKASRKKKL